MKRIIDQDRSLIPACDVDVERFEEILRATANMSEVGAYKIGATLGLSVGLKEVVRIAREYTSKPLIYDHQKAATDIPDTGPAFMRVLKNAGINAVILFPLTGPETQRSWIQAAHAEELPVIVGAHMTHRHFVASEGGWIADQAIREIIDLAIRLRVTDFVVPGTLPEVIKQCRQQLSDAGVHSATFYAPGFIAQAGDISEAAKAAGSRWHAIIGRAIYTAADIPQVVRTHAANL